VTLRIDKWPRPERSGVIAVLLVYSLLCGLGELRAYHGDGDFSLLCTIAPFCPECWQPRERVEEPPPPEYHVTRLVYCSTCVVKEQHDKCRFEAIDRYGKLASLPADLLFGYTATQFCDGIWFQFYPGISSPVFIYGNEVFSDQRYVAWRLTSSP
jgi:hypothetical protein